MNIGTFFRIQQQFWALDSDFTNRFPRENPVKRMPKYYIIPGSFKASS